MGFVRAARHLLTTQGNPQTSPVPDAGCSTWL